MRKRMLVIFSILLVIVIIVVLSSTVFTVQSSNICFYNEDGSLSTTPQELVSSDLSSSIRGKSIFFFSESKAIEAIQSDPELNQYFVVDVVRHFPNSVTIHLAKRNPIFVLRKEGKNYLLDTFGVVIALIDDASGYVDITDDFSAYAINLTVGQSVTWANVETGNQYKYISCVASTVWRFYYNFSSINTIIKGFKFDKDRLTIFTRTGAEIVILTPGEQLETKCILAFSVYASEKEDNTTEKTIIMVDQKNRVSTANK
ncbi:MAG: hypothetical protein RR418_00560 [Clostridia bacterium]